MDVEVWQAVPGYEGWYEVSDQGRVRRVVPGQGTRTGVLRLSKSRVGYLTVALVRDGVQANQNVHRLVAGAFLGLCPEGHEVNHKDSDRTNNRAENLEYVTRQGNVLHAREKGRMKPPPVHRGLANPNGKLSDAQVAEIRGLLGQVKRPELAKRYGVSYCTIWEIQTGRSRTLGAN